jgi:hypothetical protein
MLVRLDLSLADRWTTLLNGFDVLHGPVTSAILAEAGHAANATPEGESAPSIEARTVTITRFIARAVIRDWRGVVDDATGAALPVTPDTIDAVMGIWPIFRAFNERVIDARIRIDREKKDLPTLQNGTSGSEPATAPIATGSAPTAPAV